jgi:hypothetical protein
MRPVRQPPSSTTTSTSTSTTSITHHNRRRKKKKHRGRDGTTYTTDPGVELAISQKQLPLAILVVVRVTQEACSCCEMNSQLRLYCWIVQDHLPKALTQKKKTACICDLCPLLRQTMVGNIYKLAEAEAQKQPGLLPFKIGFHLPDLKNMQCKKAFKTTQN